MEITDKDIEQLETFWHGSLPDKDRIILENRLNTDAAFRREANKIRLFTEGLQALRMRQAQQHLKDLDATLPPLDPPNSTNWVKIALVALAFALAAFGVWYFMSQKPKPEISPMVAVVFEPYPALGIDKGDAAENAKIRALQKYATNDFEKAVPLLGKAFDMEKDSMLLFYQAIAYIGAGQSKEAVPLFEPMQSSLRVPVESVYWFLALAYIETNQKEKALILLKKVENTEGGKYREKAKGLIEKLN